MAGHHHRASHPAFETEAALRLRDEADELLQRLVSARDQSERRYAETGQRDAIKSVTGRSALEDAVATTRRMIQDMDTLLAQMNRDLAHHANGHIVHNGRNGNGHGAVRLCTPAALGNGQ